MRAQDVDRFRALLTALAESKGKQLSDAQFDLWWAAVRDMDIATFERAINANFRLGDRFMPSAGELRQLVEGSNQDRAALAWDRVSNAILSHGTYTTVAFDDPAIHATIASMGGWIAFGQREADDFTRKEFERVYRAFAQRVGVDGVRGLNAPAFLVGICEAQNRDRGHRSQAPKLIGNVEKIAEWQAQLDVPAVVAKLIEGGKAA